MGQEKASFNPQDYVSADPLATGEGEQVFVWPSESNQPRRRNRRRRGDNEEIPRMPTSSERMIICPFVLCADPSKDVPIPRYLSIIKNHIHLNRIHDRWKV